MIGDDFSTVVTEIGKIRAYADWCPHLGQKRTWKCHLQHPWKIRALHRARVIDVMRALFRTVGGDIVEPVDHPGVVATAVDQVLQVIAAGTAALATVNVYDVEPADQVEEDDQAVAGHMSALFRSAADPRPSALRARF